MYTDSLEGGLKPSTIHFVQSGGLMQRITIVSITALSLIAFAIAEPGIAGLES